VIQATGVTVRYGQMTAVSEVDLTVEEGQIAGVIGPNGAGKTTLLECIEGLRAPDSGRIVVGGLNPQKERTAMAAIAGVQLQHSTFPPRSSVDDLCKLFAGCYTNPEDYRELLEMAGLSEHRKRPVVKLSGGQQQRLALCLALIGRPKVVFLDELTTGLDPAARRAIWEELRRRNDAGLTVLLTSHHMDEVEQLCDQVTVLTRGKVVAKGTPAELVRAHSLECVELSDLSVREALEKLDGVTLSNKGKRLVAQPVSPEARDKVEAIAAAKGVSSRRLNPSLEDAYLNLTGETADVR
jgi:ABC-2 type transport system ATP-binding protein